MDEVKTCLIPYPATLFLWGRSGQEKDQAHDFYFALLALHGGITGVFWSLGCIWILLILLDSRVPARKVLYSSVGASQTEVQSAQHRLKVVLGSFSLYKHMTYQHSWRMNNEFIGSFTNEIQLKLGPRVVGGRNYCGR